MFQQLGPLYFRQVGLGGDVAGVPLEVAPREVQGRRKVAELRGYGAEAGIVGGQVGAVLAQQLHALRAVEHAELQVRHAE